MRGTLLLAASLALAACGVRGPPRPPTAEGGPADAGSPSGQPPGRPCPAPECAQTGPQAAPCAEADGGCAP